jgi:hypothetical protein
MESEYRLIRVRLPATASALSQTFSISRLIKYLVPALELIERKDEIRRLSRGTSFQYKLIREAKSCAERRRLRLANSLFTAFIWRGTSPPPAGNTFAGVIAREQGGLRPELPEFRQLAHFALLNLHKTNTVLQ